MVPDLLQSNPASLLGCRESVELATDDAHVPCKVFPCFMSLFPLDSRAREKSLELVVERERRLQAGSESLLLSV